MDAKTLLKDLYNETQEVCSPFNAIRTKLQVEEDFLNIEEQQFKLNGRPVWVFSVGKASIPMYESLDEKLGKRIQNSLVITSDKESLSASSAHKAIAASHPVPDIKSKQAGDAAFKFFEKAPEDALLLCLISGGTSSLLSMPAEGISIDDLNRTYALLNNSGANIFEINTVRKHCSRGKGGQLLRVLDTTVQMVNLFISDVPGDELSVIGSGPTVADESTFQDAYHILLEYSLWDKLPDAVCEHIEKGINGVVPETLKKGDRSFHKHESYIIGSAAIFAQTLAELAVQKGYKSWVSDEPFNESTEKVAAKIADKVLANIQDENPNRPSLYIFYGESTVQVKGTGEGGRNQELAMYGMMRIDGYKNISWLSAGTDGIDGPTDAAGAIVDGTTAQRARDMGIDPQPYLDNNDSYNFHGKLDTLFKTGPTGNNVMDIALVYVDK
jgi:hydroxypyruvate reductase/glycerate 2-kinase